MKVLISLILILFVGMAIFTWADGKEKKESQIIIEDITPAKAYGMLKKEPEHTFLIDVRTMAEYELVGHPPTAYNIPYKFWTIKGFKKKQRFVKDVEEKFKKTDTLLMICRSGKRSRDAGKELKKAGFENVFNIAGGFEGKKVKDRKSAYFGHRRRINGWQHDGLPYTYKCEKKFHYKLHEPCACP